MCVFCQIDGQHLCTRGFKLWVVTKIQLLVATLRIICSSVAVATELSNRKHSEPLSVKVTYLPTYSAWYGGCPHLRIWILRAKRPTKNQGLHKVFQDRNPAIHAPLNESETRDVREVPAQWQIVKLASQPVGTATHGLWSVLPEPVEASEHLFFWWFFHPQWDLVAETQHTDVPSDWPAWAERTKPYRCPHSSWQPAISNNHVVATWSQL